MDHEALPMQSHSSWGCLEHCWLGSGHSSSCVVQSLRGGSSLGGLRIRIRTPHRARIIINHGQDNNLQKSIHICHEDPKCPFRAAPLEPNASASRTQPSRRMAKPSTALGKSRRALIVWCKMYSDETILCWINHSILCRRSV